MIYLDFSKAFDRIPHPELLHKLWHFGITGSLWSWFKSYLEGHTHFVQVDDTQSPILPVRSGVPQGRILDPLLFLIYINDLPNYIILSKIYMTLYADDTKLTESNDRQLNRSCLQDDLSEVGKWCSQWLILLIDNESKCSCVHFSLRHSNTASPLYFINNQPIKVLCKQTDLGILISSDLTWSHHIQQICRRAYHTLGFIRRSIHSYMSTVIIRKNLYLTLVRSKITYCSQLWRPLLLKDIKAIESIQKRATKFILSDFTSDYKQKLTKLHLLPIMYYFELQDIMFAVKSLKNP